MVNTAPIQVQDVDHSTPIFDQLLKDWGHTPGTLTEAQEEEMREYAAKLAADPNPIVKGFEPAELVLTSGEVREQLPKPVVPVIAVGTLADKAAQEAADVIVAQAEEKAVEAVPEPEEDPEDPDAPELLPEAATQLLERVVPATEDTAVMPAVAEAETAVLPVVEADTPE